MYSASIILLAVAILALIAAIPKITQKHKTLLLAVAFIADLSSLLCFMNLA